VIRRAIIVPATIVTGLDLQVPLIFNVRASASRCACLDLETFRSVEDDVDAATPVDAQNAPTGVWKSRTEREIPTASTSITLLEKKENEEEQRQLIPTVHEIGSGSPPAT